MKERQIVEMAKVIEKMPWRIEQGEGLGCRITNNIELAEYFYNAGFRRQSKDVAPFAAYEQVSWVGKKYILGDTAERLASEPVAHEKGDVVVVARCKNCEAYGEYIHCESMGVNGFCSLGFSKSPKGE